MLKIIKEILSDLRILLPLLFLLAWEGCLQLGLYSPLLRPRSYAGNVRRIIDTVSNSSLEPDLLILGTSVAYQGVNVKYLNELLAKDGLVVQSAATEGAMLITQNALYRQLRGNLGHLKGILHITELSFPWTARRLIDPPNRSMLAQLNRTTAFELLDRYKYNLRAEDYSYLLLRSLTYQADLREFFMNPAARIKALGKERQRRIPDYAYLNEEKFALSAYPARDLRDCMRVAETGVPEIDSSGQKVTNEHHRQAVWRTCELAVDDPLDRAGYTQWNKHFFENQLAELHKDARSAGHAVFTIFPPNSDLIPDLNADWRLHHWNEGLSNLYGKKEYSITDLRRVLDGKENHTYYYDTIHLNQAGSKRFTEALAKAIQKKILPALRVGS